MIRVYVEEAAALVAASLFAGMVIYWANIAETLVLASRAVH